MTIDMSEVFVNRGWNCRAHILPDDVRDLAESMREHGLLQPVVVQPASRTPVPNGERYRLIAGFRRFMAAQQLGWREIPAIVCDVGEGEAQAINLIENLDRRNLNCLEEAKAMERRFPRANSTIREISARLRKHPTWVQARWDLLKLPADVQELFANGNLKLSQLDFIKHSPDVVQAALDAAEKRAREQKPKPAPARKRRRTKREISKMIVRLIDDGREGLTTRALAWAAGYVSTEDLDVDIEAALRTPDGTFNEHERSET